MCLDLVILKKTKFYYPEEKDLTSTNINNVGIIDLEPMLPPKKPSEIFSKVSPPSSVFQTPPPADPK